MNNRFFGAANTEEGFFSLFEEIFSPKAFRHIYILKGGPGTGKSTFMRSVGAAAEKKGYDVEYIFCSSDPKSLDGVLLPSLSAAILDGTSPHTADPIYPGAVERIINLGDGFDLPCLEKKRDTLCALIDEKKNAYRSAYRYLSAAGCIARERDERLSELFLSAKAEAAVGRLLSALRVIRRGEERHRYLSAITGQGLVHFDTLLHRAKKVYAVTDSHGLGFLFMQRLHHALSARKIAMTVCREPLVRTHTEAIFLEGEELLFFVSDGPYARKPDKLINSNRFVRKEALSAQRPYLRFAEKCKFALLEGAYRSLADAAALHEKAEKIYSSVVDFSKVDTMREQILSEIFANNM